MSKPSTDTKTELAVERYRRERIIPARVTLRFLALLRPAELKRLANLFWLWSKTRSMPLQENHSELRCALRNRRDRARNLARFELVQSERRQRGHIK